MRPTLYDRLLRREYGENPRHSTVRAIYGDRKWIKELDIVNELDGHSGCVNALSWSKSGNLLASGSDDTHLNIHSYQPAASTSQFKLATTVSTGHTANIFSVKFMPHSNDRTLITAAGDGQVRIFDIEYSAGSSIPSTTASHGSTSHAQGYLNHGVQYLSEADTNARVYRSHSDRVKRIVTESSPHLFLTCSEDGEVRQWDLRQPSSAYPKAPGNKVWRSNAAVDMGSIPPLISYKRWHMDINTISCSPSQPHYIALGGAHLHCFLHDRRMVGRDRGAERATLRSSGGLTDHDDELMGEATQCVKRFAPNGQRRMKRTDNGHITSCKISDANPNEMIVSWSGEWIYNFDLLRAPDAREVNNEPRSPLVHERGSGRGRHSNDRKRKRTKLGSPTSQDGAGQAAFKARRTPQPEPHSSDEVALRVRYENGQSESIPIRNTQPTEDSEAIGVESTAAVPQQRSHRLATSTVKIRKYMFSLGEADPISDRDPTGHSTSFTSVVGFSASTLNDMDDIMRAWRYPVDPDDYEVEFQKNLRYNRESARRFIQAAGTIARVLGGRLRFTGNSDSRILDIFARIVPAPTELPIEDCSQQFSYDFMKAICLWLDSGPGALVDGFARQADRARNHPRFPMREGAGIEAIDDVLIPYLLDLAGSRPIRNVDTSRFEVDDNRIVFDTEQSAVLAFASAVKIPFQDLSSAVVSSNGSESLSSRMDHMGYQDRRIALKFWAFKVARGVLLNAGAGMNHALIDRAFGGSGESSAQIRQEERLLDQQFERIDSDGEDATVGSIQHERLLAHIGERVASGFLPSADNSDENSEGDIIMMEAIRAAEAGRIAFESEAETEVDGDEDDENEEEDDSEDEDEEEEDSEDEEEEEDEDDEDADADFDDPDDEDMDDDAQGPFGHFLYRSSFERTQIREQIHADIPCSTHTRYYRGHCNIKTVKDVNFFGLQDEYVVSGSDSGHLFIWDRKSSELLNILEGDGETVNVIQGHPYEPMLAVSGIDHTIKIFSPDGHSRENARNGQGIAAVDPSGFSSLNYTRRSFGMRRPRRTAANANAEDEVPSTTTTAPAFDDDDTDTEPPTAPSGLSSRKRMHLEYQITSQNDVDRQGGNRDAVISRAMLAQIAARMRARPANDGGGAGAADASANNTQDDGEQGGTGAVPMVVMGPDGPVVVHSDNCSIM